MRIGMLVVALAALAGCAKQQVAAVPEAFRVRFDTSAGDILVETRREWAPRGVGRFYELVQLGYFNEGRFFRVIPGFIAQFGVHKDPATHRRWRTFFILDDPPLLKNQRGTLAFAQDGPNTRATEIFINLKDNPELDQQKFVPFARIVAGLEVADRLYSGYGELRPIGRHIDAGRVEEGANDYLVPRFPELDFIEKTEILPVN